MQRLEVEELRKTIEDYAEKNGIKVEV